MHPLNRHSLIQSPCCAAVSPPGPRHSRSCSRAPSTAHWACPAASALPTCMLPGSTRHCAPPPLPALPRWRSSRRAHPHGLPPSRQRLRSSRGAGLPGPWSATHSPPLPPPTKPPHRIQAQAAAAAARRRTRRRVWMWPWSSLCLRRTRPCRPVPPRVPASRRWGWWSGRRWALAPMALQRPRRRVAKGVGGGLG